MQKKVTFYTIKEATNKIESYCAYQERCHKEVRQKLRDMRMNSQEIDQIVTELIIQNFLNEERFAQSYARGKFKFKKWGRNRIVNELKFRDISSYNIRTALKEIDDADYYESFHALSVKRFEAIRESDPQKIRKKLADYLLYRGWESNLVYEKVNDLVPYT